MATIKPLFDQPPETERLPTPFRDVPYSPLGFGAATGAGIQDLAQVALKEHQQHRAAQVMQRVGQFGEQADALLNDPNGGILNLEGEKALGAYDGTVKALRDLQTKTAQGIADQGQRTAFMEHSEGVLRTAVRQLEVHTSTQSNALKTQGLLSTQKSMFNSSVKAIDQTSADSYISTAADATRAYWTDHANAQIAEEKVQEYIATANAGRLDRLLANPNTQGDAIRFFQSRHDALPADKLDTYEAKVAAVGDAAKADAEAIRISNGAMQQNGQVNRRAAQAQIDKLPAGAMKDHVQARVDHRASVFDAAWRDERDLLAGKVADQMLDPVTGELNPALANPADMRALEIKDEVRATALKKGAQATASKAKYAQALEHFFGDPEARQRTMQMSADEFRTDPVLASLVSRHRAPIIDRFNAMQKNVAKQKPPEGLIIEEAKKALSLGDKKIGQLSTDKQEKFADLFDAVSDDMKDFTIHHDGQQPDKEKIREYIRNEVQVTASHWFTADELRFQAGAAQRRAKRGRGGAPAQPTTAVVAPSPAASSLAIPLPAVAPKGNALPGFAGWRTSKDGKMRYPADANSNVIGPGEPVP